MLLRKEFLFLNRVAQLCISPVLNFNSAIPAFPVSYYLTCKDRNVRQSRAVNKSILLEKRKIRNYNLYIGTYGSCVFIKMKKAKETVRMN